MFWQTSCLLLCFASEWAGRYRCRRVHQDISLRGDLGWSCCKDGPGRGIRTSLREKVHDGTWWHVSKMLFCFTWHWLGRRAHAPRCGLLIQRLPSLPVAMALSLTIVIAFSWTLPKQRRRQLTHQGTIPQEYWPTKARSHHCFLKLPSSRYHS